MVTTISHKLLNKIQSVLKGIICSRDFIMLSVEVDRLIYSIVPDRSFTLERFEKFDSKFTATVKSGGSFYNEFLFKNRFLNGLVFYVLFDEDKNFVASHWVHPEAKRFIDELGVTVKSHSRDRWLR